MPRRLAALVLLVCTTIPLSGQDKPTRPGPTEQGFLLPNGWTVTPAGRQVTLTDLPLNIRPLTDSKQALVATSGYNPHQLSLVDLTSGEIVAQTTVRQSWFGLAVTPEEDRVWWSGGGDGVLHTFDLKERKLTRTGKPEPPPAASRAEARSGPFPSGLTLDTRRNLLYALDINGGMLTSLRPTDGTTVKALRLGGRPYDIALAPNGTRLYVSDWAGRTLLAIEPDDLRVVARIAVGEHPNQIAVHPKDDRIFIACASSNTVSIIDTRLGTVTETVRTTLFPLAPEGSTPDALALSPDGKTLYVANADNNCVVAVDVEVPGKSQVKGFIPTGWYPTAVAVTPDGKQLLVGVGKGNVTKANPISKEEKKDGPPTRRPYPYIGTTMSGALSIVPVPDEKQLVAYTATVYRNCPYSDKLLSGFPAAAKTAIPARVGDPSPIKHVIYIIKENRTYDQVFGDMKKGNGDPALLMFGEKVSPNHHKLANEFVLLDNLYCNGQVSRDGHPWSTMAYNTDYIARDWHLTYSRRGGVKEDDEGNLEKAPSGYLWDACARAGLSYRSYGEYGKRVSTGDAAARMEARVPGLVGHICPDFGVARVQGKKIRDTENVEIFLKEFHEYEKNGNLPRFIVMSLGEDHTTGTTPGTFTPQACVASNDLALGQLVEAVSKSKYWPETAIFVIEDDAQNGPDHVDAHRTVGLVVSPYTKRGIVDSTQYSTVSMIRTMELILGLAPLSQYDAAARPMFASFSDKADLRPYAHEEARIELNEVNGRTAYGAERSAKLDFSDYDLVDDFELNEILWRAIKGVDAPVPEPVRCAIANRPVEKR